VKRGNRTTGTRLRLVLAPGVAIGPGKADLLAAIQDSGSIAAAGRTLGMSYKRAWTLIESLNRDFARPLVAAATGGRAGGGATLTPLGREVLRRYRRVEAAATRAMTRESAALRRHLVKPPRR
jgi:molybdate transport system regulatory protein